MLTRFLSYLLTYHHSITGRIRRTLPGDSPRHVLCPNDARWFQIHAQPASAHDCSLSRWQYASGCSQAHGQSRHELEQARHKELCWSKLRCTVSFSVSFLCVLTLLTSFLPDLTCILYHSLSNKNSLSSLTFTRRTWSRLSTSLP
jgi:hypothetical protein